MRASGSRSIDRDVPSYFRPGANGVVELAPLEFLDHLADLVPPPRKHRHRYHGVFAPHHKLRRAVTGLAIGNIGKRREAATGGHAGDGHGTEGCCDANHATLKPRSHDTSRIAWAKLMARVGEEFPLECPACGEVTTKPPGRRTRRGSAPTREKRHSRGERQADRERLGAGRETGARDSRAAHQSGDACGSAIGRAILLAARGILSVPS
jgi:hypothetical protein